MRYVYLNGAIQMKWKPNRLIQLLKPLYGLSMIGDYWDWSFKKHFEDELSMKSCISDAAFFFKTLEQKLVVLSLLM